MKMERFAVCRNRPCWVRSCLRNESEAAHVMKDVLGDVVATLIDALLKGALCSERDVVGTIVFHSAVVI